MACSSLPEWSVYGCDGLAQPQLSPRMAMFLSLCIRMDPLGNWRNVRPKVPVQSRLSPLMGRTPLPMSGTHRRASRLPIVVRSQGRGALCG